MSPRKQPSSLLELAVDKCMRLISASCFIIGNKYPKNSFHEREKEVGVLNQYLMSILPSRLFEILYAERIFSEYAGDPRLQILALTHPNMTKLYTAQLDSAVPQQFWIETLKNFHYIIVLHLRFICTDEIIEVITSNCPLLEDINIVSRVFITTSRFNAYVLKRNVSDAGLSLISKLKRLRILTMDTPKNGLTKRTGRYVSEAGIIKLLNELPSLEVLRVNGCDIGTSLVNANIEVGKLNLKTIVNHVASTNSIRKLIKICPRLKEISINRCLNVNEEDDILDELSSSELELNHLTLCFFPFSRAMKQLLAVKGANITSFGIWIKSLTFNIEAILCLGLQCPNLRKLDLIIQSEYLIIPPNHKIPERAFRSLSTLIICKKSYGIEEVVTLFFKCTNAIQDLVIYHNHKIKLDDMFLKFLDNGYLTSLKTLWCDYTLEMSKSFILKLIQSCNKLRKLTVGFFDDDTELLAYIKENNLDFTLDYRHNIH